MLHSTKEDSMTCTQDDLRSRTVLDAAGRVVGEIELLIFDTAEWEVSALRVTVRRSIADEAGAEAASFWRKRHVDIPTSVVQSVGDAVILSVDLDGLRAHLEGGSAAGGLAVHG